jgi:predicted amidophosphoribosyltransferase
MYFETICINCDDVTPHRELNCEDCREKGKRCEEIICCDCGESLYNEKGERIKTGSE